MLFSLKPLRILQGFLILALFANASLAVDWENVSGNDIELFYPGQASWEWMLTQNRHAGAAMVRQGRGCRACHSGQEQAIGNNIIKGGELEPRPINNTPGAITITVKTALEDGNLFIRLSWPYNEIASGQGQAFQSQVSIILDDGKVAESSRAGCWSACHSDNTGMSHASVSLTKYLARSRSRMTRTGGGENYKSATELDNLLQDGEFMEYWMVGLNEGEPPVAIDGHILDQRHVNQSPVIHAETQLQNDIWVVTFKRPLEVNAQHYKTIEPGKTYNLGFALHDNYASGRQHYISFEYTLAVGQGNADFIALE